VSVLFGDGTNSRWTAGPPLGTAGLVDEVVGSVRAAASFDDLEPA
jgi:hypothetical protein